MPTAILRSQLKVTCCNLDLAPCILQKMRDIHKRTLVGHSFIELFFELSDIYLITFCSNKHVLAPVFFSVSESVKLHRLLWVTLQALTLKTILILTNHTRRIRVCYFFEKYVRILFYHTRILELWLVAAHFLDHPAISQNLPYVFRRVLCPEIHYAYYKQFFSDHHFTPKRRVQLSCFFI